MLKYAFAHPGKIGDMLYMLPTIKTICERDAAVAYVYTSAVCEPARRLVLAQPYIQDFIVPPEYVIESFGQGVQPWHMPIPDGVYDRVFQLGFEHFPQGPLHLSIAKTAGLASVPDPSYVCPDIRFIDEPYIVLAHASHYSYQALYEAYRYVADHSPIATVQTGRVEEWVGGKSINMTGLDLLETASLIKGAAMWVGFYSGLLVVANGFPVKKVITLQAPDPKQHGLHLPNTYEIYQPQTGEELLNFILGHL